MMPTHPTPLATLPFRLLLLTAIVCVGLFCFAPIAGAMERQIPTAVNIRAYAAEQGAHLDVLVRMPLQAVKNVQFPIRGDAGTLDLAQLQTMLPGIAEYWIAGNFEIRDRAIVLSRPQVVATRLSIISDLSFNSFSRALQRFAAPDLAASEE